MAETESLDKSPVADDSGSKLMVIAFWVLAFLSTAPGIIVYLGWLGSLDHLKSLLILYPTLGCLLGLRWDRKLHGPQGWKAITLVMTGLGVTLAAMIRWSPWMSAIGLALISTGWLESHQEYETPLGSSDSNDRKDWTKGKLTYLAILLPLTIRLPLNLDTQLMSVLQGITSRISSPMLDVLGIFHYLQGNVLVMEGKRLFVEDACSGIQSLFAVLTGAVILMALLRRSSIALPAYLLVAVFWAMVMNVLRITIIAYMLDRYSIDWSAGTSHEVLGYVCLAAALLMVWSSDRLLEIVFYPIQLDSESRFETPLDRLWGWVVSFGTLQSRGDSRAQTAPLRAIWTIACAILFLPCVVMGGRSLIAEYRGVQKALEDKMLWQPGDLLAGSQWEPLVIKRESHRGSFSKTLGSNADVWLLQINGAAVRIGVCQPYPEFHDYRECYVGNGWELNGSDLNLVAGDDWMYSSAGMVRREGQSGYLYFAAMDPEGNLIQPPARSMGAMLATRFQDRTFMDLNTIMLQLWAVSESPMTLSQQENLKDLFLHFREKAREGISKAQDSNAEAL